MEENEYDDSQELHLIQPLLGVYPYILIQFEPHEGSWRMGVDYDHLSLDEVIDTLKAVVEDFED